jgi:hypothetical protein
MSFPGGVRRASNDAIPSIDMLPSVHSDATLPPRFGSEIPTRRSCSALVVLHHHDGLLRSRVAGLLHPAADLGFAAFRTSRNLPGRSLMRRRGQSPRRNRPLEEFPSIAASLRHRRWCLPLVTLAAARLPARLPFPEAKRRSHLAGALEFKALFRHRVRSVARPLPTGRHPILPWALFPFKVLPRFVCIRKQVLASRSRWRRATSLCTRHGTEASVSSRQPELTDIRACNAGGCWHSGEPERERETASRSSSRFGTIGGDGGYPSRSESLHQFRTRAEAWVGDPTGRVAGRPRGPALLLESVRS